jgi:DNA excision repair protein ERCC-2
LTPFSYFNELFGCRKDCESLNLPSPFPAENLSVSILPISTRYRQREQTLKILVDRLEDYLRQQKGNLIVYFPSYKYLKMTLEVLKERECGKELLVQESGMTEKDRSEFLQKFEENGNEKAGLAVMGGVFGEGIDLVGKKLEGAAIVGVGLPGIDQERELIRNYYEDIEKGYDFAYTFAGLTRVLQAAGRVIRTERDTGSLLLIDDRFFSRKYRNLLPLWWNIKPSK